MASRRKNAAATAKLPTASPASPAQASPQKSQQTSKPSPSSFAAIPAEAHSSVSEISTFLSTLPRPLIDQLGPITDVFSTSESGRLLNRLTTAPFADLWSNIKTPLFSSGLLRGLVCLLAGILMNHVRRTLAPWLGMPSYTSPLTDLKLAIGSPDIFLTDAMSLTLRRSAVLFFQKFVFDVTGAFAAGILARHVKEMTTRQHPDAPRRRETLSPITVDIARIFSVVYLLACAEYLHARSCYSLAALIAYVKLFFPLPAWIYAVGGGGTPAHREALKGVMRSSNVLARAAHAWGLVFYVRYALWPMVSGAAAAARKGRVGFAIVLAATSWATYVLTRWSNKYYMLLEMWPMVLVGGWVVVAVGVVLREFIKGRP